MSGWKLDTTDRAFEILANAMGEFDLKKQHTKLQIDSFFK